MTRTAKLTFVLCSVVATISVIGLFFLYDAATVKDWAQGVAAFVAEVARLLLFALELVFAGCFVVAVAYAVIRLRAAAKFSVIRPGKYGNAQALIDTKGRVTRLAYDLTELEGIAGLMRSIPAPTSYNQTTIEAADPTATIALPPPVAFAQPRLSEALEKLHENAVEVYWGRRTDTGEDCVLSLPEATHTQKSGMTGLGKSYLTRAELTCLHLKNTPSIIQFAYIDTEGETTEAFWNAPHTWQFATRAGQKHVTRPAIATELEDIFPLFDALNHELAYRDKHRNETFPFLLVVVEEAEELLDALTELPKKEYTAIIRLWKRLARRGRKRKILLDINVQNTYTDPIMRSAQRQFQLKITAAQQPTTAKSGGFDDLELLKRLFAEKKKGQFIVNHETGEYMIVAPYIDIPGPKYEPIVPEAFSYARNPLVDGDDAIPDDFPEVEYTDAEHGKTTRALPQTGSLPNARNPHSGRLPGLPTPSDAFPSVIDTKYQFTPAEVPLVINLYKQFGTVEAVLQTFKRGARWHASASAILRKEGLL